MEFDSVIVLLIIEILIIGIILLILEILIIGIILLIIEIRLLEHTADSGDSD